MNTDEDINPFADLSIQQATATTLSNQQALNDYNPFANSTTSTKATSNNVATTLSPSNQLTTTPIYCQHATEKFDNNQTRVDLDHLERRRIELEQREKHLMARERELRSLQVGYRDNNFPPLPNWCLCRPCFYQDIAVEIPTEFQKWVRYLYHLWLLYSVTLALNVIAALSYFMVDREGGFVFGLTVVYFVLFVPCSYVCWFRPAYRAFREDSASNFMIFFLVFFIQLIITILQCVGVANLGCILLIRFSQRLRLYLTNSYFSTNPLCGFILMIKLLSLGGSKTAIGFIVMFVTLAFAFNVLADGFLLFKVHRLYRQSGATLEQAQREFQSAFVNNPTVRGAAREMASASIDETLRTGT